jgi:hypothetical protein
MRSSPPPARWQAPQKLKQGQYGSMPGLLGMQFPSDGRIASVGRDSAIRVWSVPVPVLFHPLPLPPELPAKSLLPSFPDVDPPR